MKIRSLALTLALCCAITTVAEAKKKQPVYKTASHKTHKSAVHQYKPGKYKPAKMKQAKRKPAKPNYKRNKHAA